MPHEDISATPAAVTPIPDLGKILAGSPSNWGRWGPDDEVGALNHLDASHVLSALSEVRSGQVVTLQRVIGHPDGDPMHPTRKPAVLTSTADESSWVDGTKAELPGGARYADDKIEMFLQSSTQYDALGHVWHDGRIWNGYDAETTIGGLRKASVAAIAQRGVVGRAVLIDFPRFFGTAALESGHRLGLKDLLAAAESQGTEIRSRDILVLRTNYLSGFHADPAAFWADFDEPGLAHSTELVNWFDQMSIPNLVTDTIANEPITDPSTGAKLVLHNALMRNLGVAFTELCDLERLAEACNQRDAWSFLYVAAPININQASGSPVNPIALL